MYIGLYNHLNMNVAYLEVSEGYVVKLYKTNIKNEL